MHHTLNNIIIIQNRIESLYKICTCISNYHILGRILQYLLFRVTRVLLSKGVPVTGPLSFLSNLLLGGWIASRNSSFPLLHMHT